MNQSSLPPADRRERVSQNRRLFTSITTSLVIISACIGFHASVHAQLLDQSAAPADGLDQLITILIGWDFAGMTADEESAFMGMVNPLTEQEVIETLTPDQRQGREQSLRMFNDPDAYSQWVASHPLTLDQAAEREQSIWMITHPLEYGKLQDQQRTQAQRDELQAAALAISQPTAAQFLTPAQQQAASSLANPAIKPKPVTVTVPITNASAVFSATNSLEMLNLGKP